MAPRAHLVWVLVWMAGAVVCGRAAWAKSNVALWQERPVERLADGGDALAAGSALHLGFAVDPGLQWRRLDGDSVLAFNAALFAYASRFREAPRYGYSLRLDDLALQAASAPGPMHGGDAAYIGRLTADQAEAEARLYPAPTALPQIFVGGVLGAYGAAASLERGETAPRALAIWPVSAGFGAGYGRIMPNTPAVAIAQLETMLLADGIIAAPLPAAVCSQLTALWAAHVNDLGFHNQAIETLRLLWQAGAIRAEPSPLTAYRLERIIEAWVIRPLMPRWRGAQGWLLWRGSHGHTVAPSPWAMAVELRGRAAYSPSPNSQIWLEPGVAWAPRPGDSSTSLLPGLRRHDILAPGFGDSTLVPPRGAQRLRLELPARYTQQLFGSAYDPRGALALEASLALGLGRGAEVEARAGAAYTWLFSSTRGAKLGLAGVATRGNQGVQAQVQLTAAYVQGSGIGQYVAPMQVQADNMAANVATP